MFGCPSATAMRASSRNLRRDEGLTSKPVSTLSATVLPGSLGSTASQTWAIPPLPSRLSRRNGPSIRPSLIAVPAAQAVPSNQAVNDLPRHAHRPGRRRDVLAVLVNLRLDVGALECFDDMVACIGER